MSNSCLIPPWFGGLSSAKYTNALGELRLDQSAGLTGVRSTPRTPETKQRRRRGSTAKHLGLNEFDGIRHGVNPRGIVSKKHRKRNASIPEDGKVAGAAPHSPANTDVDANLATFLVDQISKNSISKIATLDPVLKASKFNISFVFSSSALLNSWT